MEQSTKYYNIMAIIDNGFAKRHILRVGSATVIEKGIIVCTLETIPIDWDGSMRLHPAVLDQENGEVNGNR